MNANFQIVISGVGGQGVLFVTRLLAEAAIANGLPVFTSETHGMAQRGGTVISHLKVGDFSSPLINPGRADGLIALKAECLHQHGGYLKPGGWAAVNSPEPLSNQTPYTPATIDADRLARELDDPRSVNLIMLGFSLTYCERDVIGDGGFYCSLDDVAATLSTRLIERPAMLPSAMRALRAASDQSATT